jgi:hypothetical protein
MNARYRTKPTTLVSSHVANDAYSQQSGRPLCQPERRKRVETRHKSPAMATGSSGSTTEVWGSVGRSVVRPSINFRFRPGRVIRPQRRSDIQTSAPPQQTAVRFATLTVAVSAKTSMCRRHYRDEGLDPAIVGWRANPRLAFATGCTARSRAPSRSKSCFASHRKSTAADDGKLAKAPNEIKTSVLQARDLNGDFHYVASDACLRPGCLLRTQRNSLPSIKPFN